MAVLADINTEELHTLKRKQLQSLCKKHGVKANGKSEELIERLTEFINKGGSENANSDSEHDDDDDDDDDDDQRYDSATEEDKSGILPSSGGQDATPAKLVKVVPLLDTKPVEMDAPASMTEIEQAQFSSQVEIYTAKLEARAAALAADMAKDDAEKCNLAYGLDLLTPKSKKSAKAISFDKAHEKLFSGSDSILSHWSAKKATAATTPSNKRTDDSNVQDSNKRPRIEVLFESPSVQPQSARPRRKSTKTKAMTTKARRTAAPSASLDGSKTISADSRVKPTSDLAALASTKLFADTPAAAEPSAATSAADFAPLTDVAPCATKKSEPASTIVSPKKSHPAKQVADNVVPTSPAKGAPKKKTAPTPSKAATTTSTSTPPAVVSKTLSAVAAEVTSTVPAAPATGPKTTGTLPKTTSNATSISTAPVEPGVENKSAAPASKPSQIPMARKIAKPKSIAAMVSKKAAIESKIQAPKKAEATKVAPKKADVAKTVSKKADVAKPNTAPASVSTVPATTKPVASQAAGVRNVESKLKSYINSKPPPPKVKAVKHSMPDSKSLPKPNPAAAKPTKPVKAPAANAASKDSTAGKDLPNYMKPTRAKEIRSQQATAKVLPKPVSGRPIRTDEGKGRFNPYNRPAKPVVAKPSTAK
ncbi:hypothetical protein GGF44_000701 [Coemansia sp. RSA 1694]|nr:hypothetical protein GGF38_000690 [Coemansia sp. RSA 25]KAJ2644305.1 hypothetical protein GGF44_000701 [Coemansia sp. RSA 1694]